MTSSSDRVILLLLSVTLTLKTVVANERVPLRPPSMLHGTSNQGGETV